MDPILLSPPDMGDEERARVLEAFDSGWMAPLGPEVDAFEAEMASFVGVADGAALSSGTAALHLAMDLLGVGPGDDVLVPTFTFVATANAVLYRGARPIFVDASPATWCVDPDLVAEELARRARSGRLPKAVITVDLYGQCADYEPLVETCDQHGVAMIEDAAEALGATYAARKAGSFGIMSVLSFNGNKVMTTGGGGMLLSDDRRLVERARWLAAQAREPVAHYEHRMMGYNYRLSNLLAAVGRAQLGRLPAMIARRREIHDRYRKAFADLPGVDFSPISPTGEPNHWLTVITVDPASAGTDRDSLQRALEAAAIESRPAWKPMHLQPLFAEAPVVGGSVSEEAFRTGLCLPSGSTLSDADHERIVDVIRSVV
jgi:dTDP-4-amino-4,6-dideoxygalactose transaminase